MALASAANYTARRMAWSWQGPLLSPAFTSLSSQGEGQGNVELRFTGGSRPDPE